MGLLSEVFPTVARPMDYPCLMASAGGAIFLMSSATTGMVVGSSGELQKGLVKLEVGYYSAGLDTRKLFPVNCSVTLTNKL